MEVDENCLFDIQGFLRNGLRMTKLLIEMTRRRMMRRKKRKRRRKMRKRKRKEVEDDDWRFSLLYSCRMKEKVRESAYSIATYWTR